MVLEKKAQQMSWWQPKNIRQRKVYIRQTAFSSMSKEKIIKQIWLKQIDRKQSAGDARNS